MQPEPPAACRSTPAVVLAIATAAVLARAVVAFGTHLTQEDFLITLRYAENLAAGHGFVYNLGERVLGTTTPLYTLLLAALTAARLPAVGIGKALNILADGALCIVMYHLLATQKRERAGVVAALLVASNPLQIGTSIAGMETSLAALLGVVAWWRFAARHETQAYLACAALFLVRWDGVLLTAVLTVAILLRERRVPWRALALFAVLVAPWLAFAWWYFGNPIPITAAAKSATYAWRDRGLMFPQFTALCLRVAGNPASAALLVMAVLGGWRVWRDRLAGLKPGIAWIGVYCGGLLWSKVLIFPWYLVPLVPLYLALAALGIDCLVSRAPATIGPKVGRAIGMAAAVILLAIGTGVEYATALREQRQEDGIRQPVGEWLRQVAHPGDTVLLEPLGYIGYYSHLHMLDTVGLVNPAAIPIWRRRGPYPFVGLIDVLRPDWCVFRPIEAERVRRVSREQGRPFDERYVLVRTFTYTAGSESEFRIYRRRADGPHSPTRGDL